MWTQVHAFPCNIKAGFGYDNSVSLQTDDAGHVGAAFLSHVACFVGLQTNDVLPIVQFPIYSFTALNINHLQECCFFIPIFPLSLILSSGEIL